MEAQLYESRESLNDTYYDHAKESQQNALDAEAEAYEENMTKFVEGLRVSLEEATLNMDEFLMGVTSMVMYNADTVLTKYEETNLPLTQELTNPWEEAKKATNSYSGNALDLMNQWTKQGGFFSQFNTSGTTNLTSPWSAGTTAATNFKTDVGKVMDGVVSNISTNVQKAKTDLANLYQQIKDTEARATSANVTVSGSGSDSGVGGESSAPIPDSRIRVLQEILKNVYYKSVPINGFWDSTTSAALKSVQKTIGVAQTGYYDNTTARALETHIKNRASQSRKNGYSSDAKFYEEYWKRVPTAFHAKGTLGTKHDEWAITDESWIGEEITLAAGKNGQLQYLKKGSSVMPADISANLVEWGKLDPSMLDITNPTANINMISNAVNKPEINLSFEALVKAERIDEGTLPEVKKFVQQEINTLVKQMNYAIKGKGGR